MNQPLSVPTLPLPVVVLLILLLSWPGSAPIAAAGRQSSRSQEHAEPSVQVLSGGNRGASHPAIYMVRSRAELAEAPLADALRQEVLNGADFRNQAVAIIFAGTRATGGYQLNLGEVIKSDDAMVIHINETAPPPNAMVTQALTYPHIALLIDNPPPSIIINSSGRQMY